MLNDARAADRIIAHYVLERQLSDQLRCAPPENRSATYTEVYKRLFASLPDHPQQDPNPGHSARVDAQLREIKRHIAPGAIFLELGCGDAALGFAAAGKVSTVYGLDVTDALVDFASAPQNFRFLHSSGTNVPLPAATVDFAYSNQLLEHLHPEDAVEQLQEVRRVLKPGGRYMCVTPSRVSGPHDISCYFDYEATCLHLREYDYRSLRTLFREAGFQSISCHALLRGLELRLPYSVIRTLECSMLMLPDRLRARLTLLEPIRTILGLTIIGVK
jgi:ubiquinone/menaquinone biosynthesis C-methylase UbiE